MFIQSIPTNYFQVNINMELFYSGIVRASLETSTLNIADPALVIIGPALVIIGPALVFICLALVIVTAGSVSPLLSDQALVIVILLWLCLLTLLVIITAVVLCHSDDKTLRQLRYAHYAHQKLVVASTWLSVIFGTSHNINVPSCQWLFLETVKDYKQFVWSMIVAT